MEKETERKKLIIFWGGEVVALIWILVGLSLFLTGVAPTPFWKISTELGIIAYLTVLLILVKGKERFLLSLATIAYILYTGGSLVMDIHWVTVGLLYGFGHLALALSIALSYRTLPKLKSWRAIASIVAAAVGEAYVIALAVVSTENGLDTFLLWLYMTSELTILVSGILFWPTVQQLAFCAMGMVAYFVSDTGVAVEHYTGQQELVLLVYSTYFIALVFNAIPVVYEVYLTIKQPPYTEQIN